MKCATARRYLFSHLDEELGPEPSLELDDHVAACGACRKRLEGERELEALFRSSFAELEQGDRRAWQRARNGVGADEQRRRKPVLLGTAILALGLVLAWSFFQLGSRPQAPPAREPAPFLHDSQAVALLREEIASMKPTSVLGAALAVSVASAASTSLLLAPDSPAAPDPVAAGNGTSSSLALQARMKELQDQQAALEESLAELKQLLESGASGTGAQRAPLVTQAIIESMVEEALAEQPLRPTAELLDEELDDEDRQLRVAAFMRDLTNTQLGESERKEVWKRVRESGLIDAVVAEFERRAEAAPLDSVARTELGTAYLNKMLTTAGGPETGAWGSKGAAAYEQALELDDHNWEARSSLAQHYYWADMRGDSIANFEVLIAQQEEGSPLPQYAATYLWLGNLYMDHGRRSDALSTWRKGLQLFPNHAGLSERLSAFE